MENKELDSEYLIVKTPPRDLSNGKKQIGKNPHQEKVLWGSSLAQNGNHGQNGCFL
jgi:hypothetical protein